jgi:catechol 2,3-dioxygenase-like lactoylglutathione lyase family enzyme
MRNAPTVHFPRDILATVTSRVARLDHIQIAAPEGCEAAAREFYGSILGMEEIEKPPILRARGGCWFQCGYQQLHIGVERDFRPAKKAHPAFVVADLDELRGELAAQGIAVVDDRELPATRRFYAEDPWGNRLEFIESLE